MHTLLHPSSLVQQTELPDYITIDKGSCIDRCKLSPYLSVGCYSYITRCFISSFVSIGSRVSLGGYNHIFSERFSSFGYRSFKAHLASGTSGRSLQYSTTIMPDVWIADNVVVLSGVTLAVGTVIGAGSVVSKSTDPYGVYVGNPARQLKLRFTPDVVSKLVDSCWWATNNPESMIRYLDHPVHKFLDDFAC